MCNTCQAWQALAKGEQPHESPPPPTAVYLVAACEELHEESERWLWALAWGSEAARAVRLPNGELRMSEERYYDTYECLRRELYAGP